MKITKQENFFIVVLSLTAFITTFGLTNNEPINFGLKSLPDLKIVTQPVNDPHKNMVAVKVTDNYWGTLEEIESKSGKLLYRPNDKSCKKTRKACGWHQLTYKALKDIKCTTTKCFIDREDRHESLKMSKLYQAKLVNYGCDYTEHKRYLSWQMGCSGIKKIVKASASKYKLPSKIMKNMSNNSMFTYKELRKLGSKKASKAFLNEWRSKWIDASKSI